MKPAAATPLILAAALLPACTRTPPPRAPMNAPALRVVFDAIPQGERDGIEAFMSEWHAERIGELSWEIPLAAARSDSFTLIAYEVQRWHERILQIRNAQGARIPSHDSVIVQLKYVSSAAASDSSASITIRAYPPGASLFIETPLPGIESRLNDDGSVTLEDARFTTRLPFAYIRSTDRIYFSTRYRGSRRFFYYDVARQTQIEVTDIQSEAEWTNYKRMRGGG